MKILDQEYLNPLAASKYLYEYQQMKSVENENIRDLSTRINNLATQAGMPLRSDMDKKNKLFSLLPLYLQETLVTSVHDQKITYEEFITFACHTQEIHDTRFQFRTYKETAAHKVNNITKEACEFCKKTNHSTIYCSYLLRDLKLKKPDAVKFWEINNMEERLRSSSNATDNG